VKQHDQSKRIAILIAVPLLVVAATAAVVVFRQQLWRVFSSAERIQETVESWGARGPLGFVVLQFVQVVVFIIPGEVVQIAGGFLFGVLKGSLLSIAGIVLGSSFNFAAARFLGLPFVRVVFGEEKIRKFDGIAHSARAQIAFFLLFLIPGIPKDVLCYVAGLSPLRFVAFLLISSLGRLPALVGSAVMGHAAASQRWPLTIALLAVSVVLFVLGLVFRERVHAFIERFAVRPNTDTTDS
jgi:uncharacterized membrane protein YdjX (TVP38/TMEM64 family)